MKLALYPKAPDAFIGGYIACLIGEPATSNPFLYQGVVPSDQWYQGHAAAAADVAKNATITIGAVPAGRLTLQVLVPETGWMDALTADYPGRRGATFEDCLTRVQAVKELLTNEFGDHCRVIQHLIKVIE